MFHFVPSGEPARWADERRPTTEPSGGGRAAPGADALRNEERILAAGPPARPLAGCDALRHRRRGGGLALDPLPPLRRPQRAAGAARRAARGRRGAPSRGPAAARSASAAGGRSPSTRSMSSTRCRRSSCRSSWSPRPSGSPASRSRSTSSTSTAAACSAWPAPTASASELEAPLAIGPELDAEGIALVRGRLDRPAGVELFALWLRGRAIGALVAFGTPARAADRARPPGRRRDHPRRPLHRRLRPGAAAQAAARRGRDPAEPAAAADRPPRRRRSRRQRPAELRGRRGLVRRRRKPRRGLVLARRRPRRHHPGRRLERDRPRRPAGRRAARAPRSARRSW